MKAIFESMPTYNYAEEEFTTRDGIKVKVGFNKITVGETQYRPKSELPIFYLMKARQESAVEAILIKHPELRSSLSCNRHTLDEYNNGYDCGMEGLLQKIDSMTSLAGADGASASAADHE